MLLSVRVASGPSIPPSAEHRRASRRCPAVLRAAHTTSVDGGAVSKEKRRPSRPTDDYHATVRSLNSRGRYVPKKSLGQHYMLNASVNEELSSAADVKEGDVVLEIGPGTGSLTNTLLNSGATVVAVEKDPRMAALIKDRFGCTERLKLIQEDITKCHIVSHLAPLLQNQTPVGHKQKLAKVVANIPFNISTEVVKLLLPMGNTFSVVVLLLQDEAAERLVDASIETPEYRSINIFVNFYSDPEYKLKVGRTNFFPQPKFDAAIVRFELKQTSEYPPVASPKSFFSMVNSAFNGKRKMLRKSLHHLCSPPEIESALDSIGLPTTSRPCELTLDDFVRLHNNLVKL
ncbi:hypothetical protein LUZ61_014895 [Rhynchospora tenuis]|uniref:rRNA adenine N(6)-methyltransferase n=1 Tax=Rhynchospora tenuis TaxID=198213 RepID=A0AAD5Z3E8_9POAL|nr:hypothetical protein LUZ61_014895 [Rhynchospora tenuis]